MVVMLNIMEQIPLIEDPLLSEQLVWTCQREWVQIIDCSMTGIEVLPAKQQEKLKCALNVDRLLEGINLIFTVLPLFHFIAQSMSHLQSLSSPG
jgi:5-methylcytosine-specific restriction endonuclease McrBC regulatory subunit McrC